jgi:hypothetical protein
MRCEVGVDSGKAADLLDLMASKPCAESIAA